jgi:signal transduction histidine kinase
MVRIKSLQSGGRIHVTFEDTGMGVPDSQQDRIFDSFYQVAEYLTREVGGLGLGLAIVRRVAEAHGGTVSVSSDGKSGSVFRFELPFRQPFVDRLLSTIHKTPIQPGDA